MLTSIGFFYVNVKNLKKRGCVVSASLENDRIALRVMRLFLFNQAKSLWCQFV